jgi:tRNA nucleotidyltransferase (CCA-adding enzyme)
MLNGPIPAKRRGARHHAQAVSEPPANALLKRLEAVPAAAALLERLSDDEDVYLVGGAVRDLLRGAAPLDLDLVVDGELEPVARRLGTPARVHDRFETRTVKLDGTTVDLARARRERYEHPGALPIVGPAGIEEDLGRRDFTVNALALGLSGSRRGGLLQVPHGAEDLEAGRLRVLHDASFIDDPTRLLRLARYAGRLGFSVEEHTRALAGSAVADGAPATVSGPRLGTELRLLAEQDNPIDGFRVLHELGLDAALAPGFGIGTDERAAVARRALGLLAADGNPADLVLAVAGLDVPPRALAELLDRLAFTAARRDRIVAAAGRAREVAERLSAACAPSQIAAAVSAGPVELVALAGALGAEGPARRWLAELRHVALEIDGSDLLAAGLEPGPAVGAGLAAARAAKLDGRAAGRDAELAEALRAAAAAGGRR